MLWRVYSGIRGFDLCIQEKTNKQVIKAIKCYHPWVWYNCAYDMFTKIMAWLIVHCIPKWMTKCLEDLSWLWELECCAISKE